ncbi:MAG: DUF4878 domain-containing protein [bacterium]|nr:DUF4878 domain-containing protein [bacterium]
MKKILIGLIAVVLVVVLVWVFAGSSSENPQQVVDSFFSSLKAGNFEKAHDYLSPELGVIPLNEFQQSMSAFQLIGNATTEPAEINENDASVKTILTIVNEQKALTVVVQLKSFDGEWKIVDLVFG